MLRSPQGRGWTLLGALCAAALGGVFVIAGLLKSADPLLFAEQIRGYQMTPAGVSLPLAYTFIVLELALGWAAILQLARRPVVLAIMALLGLFIVATAWAWAHGNAENCGCFGRAGSRGPIGVIGEDFGFLALGLGALFFPAFRAAHKLRGVLFAISIPVVLSVPLWMPTAAVDRWVTPIKPGADLHDIAVDGIRVSVSEGRVLLALLGPDCEACDQAISGLDAIAAVDGGPAVVGIFGGGNSARRAFVLEHVPTFPIGYSPEKALRQYYRRLPVFILVEDGVVEGAWWNDPPTPAQVMGAGE